MLDKIDLENILFLDIETVPGCSSFDELEEELKEMWLRKAEFLKKEEGQSNRDIYSRAGIFAEFGKIVCISCGYFYFSKGERKFRLKSFASHNETELLEDFSILLKQHFNKPQHLLCAHNGKEFDFPYIVRRMIINNIDVPAIMDIVMKKPWEVQHLDTMELWKFGDYKNYTPLNLLAYVLEIESPKDDIDGSMVHWVYWQEKDLERITTYCSKDVITIAQIILRYKKLNLLQQEEIIKL
ncbi:MAG: 3'-5' exonuclease [Bacteroidetes bacterium]|nr:3'-5' exonuclease [Bacteroidota bacterium]